jgi:hypothetical protein
MVVASAVASPPIPIHSPLQLGHLVEQVLEDVIVDLVRDGWDQGLGLLSAVAAERT